MSPNHPTSSKLGNVAIVALSVRIVIVVATVVFLVDLRSELAHEAVSKTLDLTLPAEPSTWNPAVNGPTHSVLHRYLWGIQVGGWATMISFFACMVAWFAFLGSAFKLARERFVEVPSNLPSMAKVIGASLFFFVVPHLPPIHLRALAKASDPDALPDVPPDVLPDAVEPRQKPANYRTSARDDVSPSRSKPLIPIIGWWLAFLSWIVSNVAAAWLIKRSGLPIQAPENLGWSIATRVPEIVALGLAIAVVRGIIAWQRERLRRLALAPAVDRDDEEEPVQRAPRRRAARARTASRGQA